MTFLDTGLSTFYSNFAYKRNNMLHFFEPSWRFWLYLTSSSYTSCGSQLPPLNQSKILWTPSSLRLLSPHHGHLFLCTEEFSRWTALSFLISILFFKSTVSQQHVNNSFVALDCSPYCPPHPSLPYCDKAQSREESVFVFSFFPFFFLFSFSFFFFLFILASYRSLRL